jgi:sulfoxide reductase heme-binding subunit YedZ
MDYIIFVIPIVLLVIYFGDFLHKYHNYFYLSAIIIVASSVVFMDVALFQTLTSPGLGISLLIVVMFTGAFKKKSKQRITLTKVRKELAILGYIVLIPHVVSNFSFEFHVARIFGSLAMLIMLPLFISSFPYIKKKIGRERWKKLHKLSYFAYTLMFIHATLIAIIVTKEYVHAIIYIFVFCIYLILKLNNYVFVRK